jgi:hypothetical protein
MAVTLPTKVTKATRVNPKSMVIFSLPKMGKTTTVSALDNCLLIDLEKGSYFVDAVKYDVIREAEKKEVLPIDVLGELIEEIKRSNKKKGGYVYKYIALDTVTALEDVVLPYANKLYRDTPMGRTWVGDDVTTLPNGAGYRYTRMALSNVLSEIENLCDTFIILGHVKDKLVEKDGKEMNERGLDLTGKSASILCAQVDAIGYLYRNENETIINFNASKNLISGARSPHLKGQEIVVARGNEDKTVEVDWSKIFINE